MDPPEKSSGTETHQNQNSGTGAKGIVGPSDSNGFLKDISIAALDYLSQNSAVSLKANDLLHLSFPPNPLRLPKVARFPKIKIPKGVPKGIPKSVPAPVVGIAGGTGLLALIYHTLSKVGVKMLDSCYHYGKVIIFVIAAHIALKVGQHMRHRRMEVLAEQIPDSVVLIVCDDTIAHDESRAALFEILESPNFSSMFPKCVMEGIYSEMESTSPVRSSKAQSAYLAISDLMRHQKARIEGAILPENLEDLDMGWESSDEEREVDLEDHVEKIINCAQNENRNNVLAFIITYSRDIKNRAVQRGLRCSTPQVILNWTRG